ncbi:hypothetical protein CL649_03005 [bacterium]|nr:hypothetical protein [bacterium]|tara:strand:- start:9961 stop:11271 length:1311 start_codon:yes stop_codon:yes gene_type:complete
MKRNGQHLLYIAFFFPPSRASGVYRAIATANAFSNQGWRVTVLTADERFFHQEIATADDTLLASVNDDVALYRVPFTFQKATKEDITKYGWFKANYFRVFLKFQSLVGSLSFFQKKGKDLISKYDDWIKPVTESAKEIHAKDPICHVLATGNPFSSFEAALTLHNELGISFSVDYRDPWTTNVYTGEKADLPKEANLFEAEIIRKASHAFHINSAMREAIIRQYPKTANKHHVVPNGYDELSVAESRNTSEKIVLGMLGTLNANWPLEEIFEAWNLIRGDLPDGSKFQLGGYLGYFAHSEASLMSKLPSQGKGFHYVGPIRKNKVREFYESLSVIVIPASGGALVTTGKVYEVAAQPHPIVCIQNKDGGARKALEGRPHVQMAQPNVNEIVVAFREAILSVETMTMEDTSAIQSFAAPYERGLSIGAIPKLLDSDN